MRYLFTTIPGTSYMLPLVPLAHAALAAGHEVLVVTGGPALRIANEAGLQTVAVDADAAQPYEELVRRATESPLTEEVPSPELVSYVASVFGEVGARMVDRLVDTAKAWGTDAVVYPANHVGGLLAARAAGLPAVLHGIGTPRATFGPALGYLAPVAERLGVTGMREADISVDLCPPSLEPPHPRAELPHTLPMRYTPYNGGTELPAWLLRPAGRPRVAVTLGSLAGVYGDGALLREIVLGTAELGVELVVTTGGADLPALASLPHDHVRLESWVPLNALLSTCDAIIHHGGMGTTYAAFDAGVPQLVIPLTGPESAANGRVAAARGAGTVLGTSGSAGVTAANVGSAVGNLLKDPAYRKASREVAVEMREMPTPSSVIGRLTSLIEDKA
ncbi:nucleotide disphospho-sugar-binding domain-containing protein [Streptomyces litmocidini]|uniref:nucleotide disphospho-sugar-binding domain-containing protein n=1 Tax=Streptomyces litmocidini TaxID=67318 RepID=UPI0036F9E275